MPDLSFNITAALEEASAGLKSLAGDTNDLANNLRELGVTKATPTVTLDGGTEVSAQVADVKTRLAELGAQQTQVKVEANIVDLERKVEQAKTKVDDLNAQKANPKVDMDIALVEAQISEVDLKLDDLSAKESTPKVDADIALFEAKRDILVAKLEELNNMKAHPTIDLEIAKAESDLALFQAELAAKKLEATVEVNTAKADAELGAFAAGLRTKLDAAIKSIPDIQIKGDSTDIDEKLAAIKAKMQELRDVVVTGKFDDAEMLAQIQALKAELDALSNKDVTVRVKADVDSARTALQGVGKDADDAANHFKNLQSAVDSFAGIMSTKVGLIAGSIMPLLTSIGQLSGALGLLPALATAAGAAFGTVVLGVQGLSGAITAYGTAQQASTTAAQAAAVAQQAHAVAVQKAAAAVHGGASAVAAYQSAQQAANQAAQQASQAQAQAGQATQAYAQALNALSPAARQVVAELLSLKPAFDSLKQSVQESLFQNLGAEIQRVATTDLPVLRTGLSQVGSAINEVVQQIGVFLTKQSSVQAWRQIFDDIAQAIKNASGAVQPLLDIFTRLVEVGSSLLPGLATSFAQAAQSADEFVKNAQKTGQLKQWIQTGMEAVKELWGAFKDLVAIIKDLAVEPGFGPNFLQALKDVTGAIRWLIENVPIAKTLIQAFFDAWLFAKILGGLLGLIGTIGTLVGWVRRALEALGLLKKAEDDAGGALGRMRDALGRNTDALATATTAQGKKADAGNKLAEAEGQAAQATQTLGEKLKGLAGPLVTATLGVGALTAAVAMSIRGWPQLEQSAQGALNGVVTAMTNLNVQVATKLAQIGTQFQTWLTQIAAQVTTGFSQLGSRAASGLSSLSSQVTSSLATVTAGVSTWLTQLGTQVTTGFSQLASHAASGLSALTSTVSSAFSQLPALASAGLSGLATATSSAFSQLPPIASTGVSGVGTAVSTGTPPITNNWQTWATGLGVVLLAALTVLAPEVGVPLDALGVATGAGLETGMGAEIETFLAGLSPEFAQSFADLDPVVSSGLSNLAPTASTGGQGIGTALAQGVQTGISDGWPAVENYAVQVAEELLAAAEAAIGAASPSTEARDRIGLMFSHGIAQGIFDGKGVVLSAVTDLMNGALSQGEGIATGYRGGDGDSRDGGGWGWRRHHHHHGGGGGGGGGGDGGGGGPPPVPLNYGGSAAWEVALKTGYATTTGIGAGGTEAVTRQVTGYARTGVYLPATASPSVPTASAAPPVSVNVHFENPSGNKVVDALFNEFRKGIRVRGGSVQFALGR